MKNVLLTVVLLFVALSPASVFTQTLSPHATEVKATVEKRARDGKRTKVKLGSGVSYIGTLADAADTSFTITTSAGDKHVLEYSEVRSIGGTGLGTGAKIGLGIAIGAGAVLAVLAAIVHSND